MKKNNFIAATLLISIFCAFAFGQRHTENKADQTLRGSGRINPSTLAMEIDIPLGSYPGRGIGLPVSLSYSSKVWRTEYGFSVPGGIVTGGCRSVHNARYGEKSAAGWTTSLAVPYIEYTGKDNIYDQNGNALVFDCMLQSNNTYNAYVRRLTVHLPGGETHELRADDTIKMYAYFSNCSTPGEYCDPNDLILQSNWNTTFYAVDGSNLRYVEDSATGTYRLLMPDGSRYDFAGTTATSNYDTGAATATAAGATPASPEFASTNVRKALTYTDRNGNYISYNNQTITDTLGRTLAAPFGTEAPTAPTTVGNPQIYSLPGMPGSYKFHWKYLKGDTAAESGLTDFSQNLKYPGDKYVAGPNGQWVSRPANTVLFYSGYINYVQSGQALFNPVVLTEIELPNGQRYRFTYDIYGRIEYLYHPTGGAESFAYSQIAPLIYDPSDTDNVSNQANFGVTDRKVYPNVGQSQYYQWLYGVNNAAADYTVTVTAPDGTKTERLLHRSNASCQYCTNGTYGYDNGLAGMAYEERSLSSYNQLINKKLTTWTITDLQTTSGYGGPGPAHWHPRVAQEETLFHETANSTGVSATTKYEYDGDLSQRDTPVLMKKSLQYAFVASGTAPPATPIRTTETVFLINDPNILSTTRENYRNRNLVVLPTVSMVKDAAGTIMSRSEMKYDESGYSPADFIRGNSTTSRAWDSAKGSYSNANAYIQARARFDVYGNQYETIDGKGNATTIEYDATYHAYATKVISAIPGQNGSATALVTQTSFDVTTGLPTSMTDANNQTTQMEYNDPLLRPTKMVAPNGQQTITEYGAGTSEATRYVKTRVQIDATNWREDYAWYDGLGRTYKTQSVETDGDVFVKTLFDAYGRAWKTSNPYRGANTPDNQMEWTETQYDTAGRVWKVVTPDGAVTQTDYAVAASGHFGTTITVTDQAGKERRSITDALGRLIRVDEPNNFGSGVGAAGMPVQPTYYGYDVLDNLLSVQQSGSGAAQCGATTTICAQSRTFIYDSLSRLKQATNPEMGTTPTNGTIYYVYDDNGNLTQKTDARGVATNYGYDILNRLASRSYSAPNGLTNYQASPAVTYFYDNLTNAKGRLIKVSSSVSETSYTQFDAMGRVIASEQRTPIGGETVATAIPRASSYVYNLAGMLTDQTYPSTRVVKYNLDADGDLSSVQSKKNASGALQTFADSLTYTAAGAVSSMKLGNNLWESAVFNSRLQPTQIALGSSQSATDKLKLNFAYFTNTASENNGNVTSQTITVPTTGGTAGFVATQSYAYDSVNRLKSATETISGNQSWKQVFLYDRYGNRNFDTGINTTTTLGSCSTAQCNPTVNPNTNRFAAGQGYDYDLAGNLKLDTEGRAFTYDGENKQTLVKDVNNNDIGQYFYDGDGKRVKKYIPTTGEQTVFIYDAFGKLVAEYSNVVEPVATAKRSYLTQDHLGSPRITTDKNGTIIARRDFMPFGEEITAMHTSQRNSNLDYSDPEDKVRQKFTSYERDIESDLDFAQARYYNPKHGRFTSVDPLMASADITNPQTFNRYSYVGNNPINFNDPTGEIWGRSGDSLQWFDTESAMKKAGFTAYTALVGQIGNKLVVLSATSNTTTPVANPAAALRLIAAAVGTGAAAFGASASVLGIPAAILTAYVAAVTYSPGQVDATMDDCMVCGRMIQNHVNMMNGKIDELEKQINQSSTWKGGETSPADPNSVKPDPKNNEPKNERKANEPRFKTDAEAAAKAQELGYTRTRERSNGQAVFRKGRSYITRDVDGHNGGAWKKANSVRNLGSNRTRQGTYDEDLNYIGP